MALANTRDMWLCGGLRRVSSGKRISERQRNRSRPVGDGPIWRAFLRPEDTEKKNKEELFNQDSIDNAFEIMTQSSFYDKSLLVKSAGRSVD